MKQFIHAGLLLGAGELQVTRQLGRLLFQQLRCWGAIPGAARVAAANIAVVRDPNLALGVCPDQNLQGQVDGQLGAAEYFQMFKIEEKRTYIGREDRH